MKNRASEPFALMAKPAGPLCNMACTYCYYLKTADMYEGSALPIMSEQLLDIYIRSYIQASPGPVVPFTWHGGEPTLAGLDFYRKAVELQGRYLPPGWEVWNNIQTNGLLLDDEWCSFLKDARFDVGLSIDGTQQNHDRYRRDKSNSGTYGKVAESCRRLQDHGIQPDLLCTVTSTAAEDPVGIYGALRDLDTGWIQFIPIVRRDSEGHITPDSVTPEGYGHFLCATFDEWLINDIGRLEIQQIAEMGLVWSGGATNLCHMAPTCGRVLVVEHDGAIYSCDHFVDPGHKIGNIATCNLPRLVDSPAQRLFGNRKRDTLSRECASCPWLDVCNGGCPKDRFSPNEDPSRPSNYLCEGLKTFFAHAEKPLKRVLERRRQGASPTAIMQEQRNILKAKWKGVGRNDPCPCGSGKKAKNCCWDRRP